MSHVKPTDPEPLVTPYQPILSQEHSSSVQASEPKGTEVSHVERFVAAFFHESNIKWMLFIGAAIVTVSSLKLVHQQWDAWSATFKFLSILVYVAAVYGFAEASGKLLGLRSTSSVLKMLTLILLPISFFALPWLAASASQNAFSLFPLLAIGAVFAATVSDRIFKSFLLERQLTFQAAYLALALTGAIPTIVDGSLLVAAAIWLVGTVGIIKINRHVFWLAEQHRKPLVMGFLPILLLGAQMVVLFATKLNWLDHLEWLGFGLVLCSVPIVLTARTVAHIYKARTGGLLVTIPLDVAIPLLVGLVMAASGVVLSFTGFYLIGPTTFAAVPTCVIAATLAWLAARDTNNAGFTWISIVLMLVAYQVSPTLVSSFARQAISVAASTLSEERLPIAFYGLTYLPLLLGWTIASRILKGRAHFNKPLQTAATCLTLLLMPLSLTHVKAAFLIPVVHGCLFLAYAIVWKDRRYVVPFLGALTVAVGYSIPFSNAMLGTSIAIPYIGVCLGTLGCLMLLAPLDPWLNRIPICESKYLAWPINRYGKAVSASVVFGAIVMASVGAYWFAYSMTHLGAELNVAQLLVGLLVALGAWIVVFKTRHYLAGMILALVLLMFSTSVILAQRWSPEWNLNLAVTAAVVVSILGYFATLAIRRRYVVDWQAERIELGVDLKSLVVVVQDQSLAKHVLAKRSLAFLIPAADLATAIVTCALVWQWIALVQSAVLMMHGGVAWCGVALLVWFAFMIAVTRSSIVTAAFVGMVPLLVSSFLQVNALIPSSLNYSVLVWACTSFGAGVIPFWIERHRRESQIETANTTKSQLTKLVPWVCSGWLSILTVCGIVQFSVPVQFAGLISLGGLAVFHRPQRSSLAFGLGAMWANVFALMLVLPVFGIKDYAVVLQLLNVDSHILAGLPILLLTVAINGFLVQWLGVQLDRGVQLAWSIALRMLFVGLLFRTALTSDLDLMLTLVAIIACVVVAVEEFWMAMRDRNETRVWASMLAIAASILLLFLNGFLSIDQGSGLLVLVIGGMALQWLGDWFAKSEPMRVASRPFQIVGWVTPSLTVGIGLLSMFLGTGNTAWVSLAIFLSSFIHAYRGWSSGHRWHAWLALAMVNIGIANINRSLGWFDLQLYLTPIGLSILGLLELMKREVPLTAHKPIRLIGALCILVSPVFQILSGSWWHMFSLMFLSVLVVLIAIGIRVRVLMYTGIAFLLADLLTMLVRSAIDHPNMLWVSGLGFGLLVIAIGAVCEVYRERLLSKMRTLSSELASWK